MGRNFGKYIIFILFLIIVSCAPPPKNYDRGIRYKIVTEAKKYVGVPYKYGGITPKGFDCSGFAVYIYGKFGIKLPRTVRGMASQYSHIPKYKLRQADLVVFYKPWHVGIMIDSKRFIHASSKGIMISSLDESYYFSRFMYGLKVIKN